MLGRFRTKYAQFVFIKAAINLSRLSAKQVNEVWFFFYSMLSVDILNVEYEAQKHVLSRVKCIYWFIFVRLNKRWVGIQMPSYVFQGKYLKLFNKLSERIITLFVDLAGCMDPALYTTFDEHCILNSLSYLCFLVRAASSGEISTSCAAKWSTMFASWLLIWSVSPLGWAGSVK